MAAGRKFSTMLHGNKTCRVAMVLIYVLLEWVIIGLLFLNSIFSDLISKYVSYFRLSPSCVVSSRLQPFHHQHDDGDLIVNVNESGKRLRDHLYAELEEERNASDVAANQAMAMMTRLQEEKSAIKMDALQYKRLVEEQSEYAEKTIAAFANKVMEERDGLFKELDHYRTRLLAYEAEKKQTEMANKLLLGAPA